MKFDDATWDRGCCAETLQINVGNAVVLVTHTFDGDTYRIERYVNNKLAEEKLGLTREGAEASLLALQ